MKMFVFVMLRSSVRIRYMRTSETSEQDPVAQKKVIGSKQDMYGVIYSNITYCQPVTASYFLAQLVGP